MRPMRVVAPWPAVAALALLLAACAPGGGPPVLTTLYVHPTAGSNGAAGTIGAPLRTLSAALGRASSGVTIHLAAGTYGAANGETWPTQVGFPPVATPNVPAGVTIVGTAGVRLVGPGGATTAAALAFAGAATVHDVEIEGFQRAILAWLPGEVVLTRVGSSGNSVDGLLAFGAAEVVAVDALFEGNGLSGVAAFGDASLDLQGGEVSGNRTGVFAADRTHVGVLDTRIDLNGSQGDPMNSGVYADGESTVTLSGVTLEFNSLAGVEVRGAATVSLVDATVMGQEVGLLVANDAGAASLRVHDSDVRANGTNIRWAGPSGGELVVRGTTVRFAFSVGVEVVGAPDVVDFGAAGVASGNRIEDNGSIQFADARPARAAPDGPVITVDVASIAPPGCFVPIGILIGPASFTCDSVNYLAIGGANQVVRVVSE